jgi:hypothetical protein
MRIIKAAIIIICIVSLTGTAVFASENKPGLSERDKAMALLEKYAAPGENHKHLDYFTGRWESQVKMFGGPGGEPIVSKQDITVKWILGGRYTHAHIKGNLSGKDYDVFVYTGYDNYQGNYFAIQLSTLDTGYFISTGVLDKSGKVRTETGIMDDVSGEKIKLKAVTTLLDRDTYRYELYAVDPRGKETRSMEIVYNRK